MAEAPDAIWSCGVVATEQRIFRLILRKNCSSFPRNSIDRRFASPTMQYWLNNVVRAVVICFCAALVIGIHQLGLIISLIGKA
jgi:hypothetical protein